MSSIRAWDTTRLAPDVILTEEAQSQASLVVPTEAVARRAIGGVEGSAVLSAQTEISGLDRSPRRTLIRIQ
jgi:hypothetical protein